ncbi:unnamed protein product [Larinioides sclopetarius]|uniref:Uncharacterized protein n=1 Tax=Larinioides sclopetarius TaxID=280406 RepID=A0AAV1ZLL6_9ARAC
MDEENFNEALYLYNAVIEYINFLIALIEAEGPRDLNNVEKHLKFFNHDIYCFAEIFSGEDLAEKIGSMLCATTPIFNVKERLLNLSCNDEYFKRTIYKDLLISKIVDLVLRGMYCIKDICHNLNLNSMITIEEKSLSLILKKYPYFDLDSNKSVIICQFHGLLGFEDHAYKTVVRYFQSYLQNINVLTYSEVILHEKFIPTCAISNPLFLFCALHVCSIFKCKKGQVKLRKKFRKKVYGNQIINIEKLNMSLSKSVPIGLLVSKALGRTLYNWTGEISELAKSTGQIQCVVSFSNDYQGIFIVYLYKTALKHICETEDLNDYLSIRDIVEFDAKFCDEIVDQHIFWQATRIKVIKQSLKKNKFELDVDAEMYFERIKLNNSSFNISSKTCHLKNCNAKFFVLQKNLTAMPKSKAIAKCSSDLNTEFSSKLQSTISENSSNLSEASSDCLMNKTVETTNDSLPLKDTKGESLCVSKDLHDINLSAVDSNQNNVLISDLLFLHSSFVFGEVSVTSEDDGIAVTMNALNQFNVFFKSEAVFTENTKRIPAKGKIVLLYIPYFDSKDSSCVATLVYPLNSEESLLLKENISIENFVMDNFFPVVQKNLGDTYSCFCGLAHILTQRLLIPQEFETKGKKICKAFDFIKNLQEAVCFSSKTLTLFYMLINKLYSQNLGTSCTKLCADLAFVFVQAFSFTNCSNKLKVLYKKRKTLNNHSNKRNHRNPHFLSYQKTACSETSDTLISSFQEEMKITSDSLSLYPKSDIKEETSDENKNSNLSEKVSDARYDTSLLQVEQGHGSCISINSYKSCNSKSSDDVFYSCESDSDSEKNENSIPSQSNNIHLLKENGYKNAAANCNEVNDSLSLTKKSCNSSNIEKDIPEITLSTFSKKFTGKLELAVDSDFKLKHSSLSKAKNRKNKKVILPSSNNHCKECWKPVIETTAYISTITNSCLYFCAKYNQQIATLGFPRYLVSEEVLKNLSLGSSVKIGIIPNILLHFSDVLYINLC